LATRYLGYERHKITVLYEEVIQASRGSRWLWALTFASSIEGLVRMLSPRGNLRPDIDAAAISGLSRTSDHGKIPAFRKKLCRGQGALLSMP